MRSHFLVRKKKSFLNVYNTRVRRQMRQCLYFVDLIGDFVTNAVCVCGGFEFSREMLPPFSFLHAPPGLRFAKPLGRSWRMFVSEQRVISWKHMRVPDARVRALYFSSEQCTWGGAVGVSSTFDCSYSVVPRSAICTVALWAQNCLLPSSRNIVFCLTAAGLCSSDETCKFCSIFRFCSVVWE